MNLPISDNAIKLFMLESNNNDSAMKVLLPSFVEGIEVCEESNKSLSTGWTLNFVNFGGGLVGRCIMHGKCPQRSLG